MPDLSFLPKAERRVATMALVAVLLVAAGWKLRDLIGDAQAAEKRVGRLERRVDRIDRNLVLLLHDARVTPVPEEDAPEPAASGVGP